MTEIKPIETRYAGCRFRSRLEARYAIWFDRLGIEWQYEPEGFEVGPASRRRAYLPDFYLPARRLWVEVKGAEDALDYDLMVQAATIGSGLPSTPGADSDDPPLIKLRLLILGPVHSRPTFHFALLHVRGVLARQMVTPVCELTRGPDPTQHHGHLFSPVMAPIAAKRDLEADVYVKPHDILGPSGYGFPCPQITDAYTSARSARFEHGEVG